MTLVGISLVLSRGCNLDRSMIPLIKKIPRFLGRNLALARLLRNWREVASALHSAQSVQRLEFRSGMVLSAPESAHLGFLFAEIWLDRVYSPRGYKVQNGDVVIDVGANVGVFSSFAALQARDVSVYAYEPFPDNARLLRSNVAALRHSRVKVHEEAVAGSTERRFLQTHSTNWIVHTLAAAGSCEGGLSINCVSLDDLLERNGIERCHLLKLDCEGTEYEILRSAGRETLERIDRIVGEYHRPPDASTSITAESLLSELLRSGGFTVDGIHPFGGGDGGVFHARRGDHPRQRLNRVRSGSVEGTSVWPSPR